MEKSHVQTQTHTTPAWPVPSELLMVARSSYRPVLLVIIWGKATLEHHPPAPAAAVAALLRIEIERTTLSFVQETLSHRPMIGDGAIRNNGGEH